MAVLSSDLWLGDIRGWNEVEEKVGTFFWLGRLFALLTYGLFENSSLLLESGIAWKKGGVELGWVLLADGNLLAAFVRFAEPVVLAMIYDAGKCLNQPEVVCGHDDQSAFAGYVA